MLLGKDITLEDFNGAKAFFGGASRAATITRDYLARYAALEEDGPATSWDARDITPANAMAMFPFLDFWPWMRHKDEDFLANTMCFLVRSLNPFVLVSFSRFVSSVAAANFGHTHGFSS